MKISEVWAVYDISSNVLVSVHPFKELAERVKNMLDTEASLDRLNKAPNYMICTLETTIMWLCKDAAKQGEERALKDHYNNY